MLRIFSKHNANYISVSKGKLMFHIDIIDSINQHIYYKIQAMKNLSMLEVVKYNFETGVLLF